MKARLPAILAALVLAGLGTALLGTYVADQGDDGGGTALGPTTEVLIVQSAIDAGTAAADLTDSVALRSVPEGLVADGAVTDLAEVADSVTTADLLPGEQVLADRFVAPDDYVPGAIGFVAVPDDLNQVSFSITNERALGGQVRPGDRVAFLASFTVEADEGAAEVTSMLIHDLLVTAVSGGATVGDDGDDEEAAAGPLTVTLAGDAHQVERIVFSKEFGRIWLARSAENGERNEEITYFPGVLADDATALQDWLDLTGSVLTPPPSPAGDPGPATADDPPADEPVPTATGNATEGSSS